MSRVVIIIIIISIRDLSLFPSFFSQLRFPHVQGRLAFSFSLYLLIVLVDHLRRLISMHLFVFHNSFCCRYGERLQYAFMSSVSHFLLVIINTGVR